MKVLVVGGTRFIGRYVVEELLSHGHKVILYHRGRHEVTFSTPVEHIHGDRRDYEEFKEKVAGLSLDAVVDIIPYRPEDSQAIVEAFRGRIGHSVHLSTGAVYARDVPIPISEDTPLSDDPNNVYAYNKILCERVILEAQNEGGFPATILRLAAVYGPHDYEPREWFFVRRILDGRKRIALPGTGEDLFHRVYVRNVAAGVVLALENPQSDGQIYNLAHEKALTLRQITEMIARILNHRWEIVAIPRELLVFGNPYAMPRPRVFDISKIKNDLGYREPISPEQGMKKTVEWLLQNPPEKGSWWEYGRSPSRHCPFDYTLEDQAVEEYKELLASWGK